MDAGLEFIIYACEEYEVFAERFEQVFHRDHRSAGGNKIVEHDYVAFLGRFFAKGKDRPDTVLRVALGNIFVERYAEKLREPGRNERRKISDLVATLGRDNDAPVTAGERAAEYLTDELYDVGSKNSTISGSALLRHSHSTFYGLGDSNNSVCIVAVFLFMVLSILYSFLPCVL